MSEIKARPTPGYRYQVVSGDRLKAIARTAYGSEKYAQNIVEANPDLKDRKISLEGLPTIYREILVIPRLKPQAKTKLQNRDPLSFVMVIEGREIIPSSASLVQTMNHGADGWTATIPWNPGKDKELDALLLPVKMPEAQIYIGGQLANNGKVYGISAKFDGTQRVKDLSGFSHTIDLVNSSVSPPYEFNKITLEQLAPKFTMGTGIIAEFQSGIDTGGPFDRVTAGPTDKKFDFLAKLAAQRGILVSNTIEGNLLFHKANTTGKAVGTIQEGGTIALSWASSYDGTQLFNSYKAIGESPGGDAQTSTAIDDNIPAARNTTFEANETTPGDIGKAAEWQRSKRYADALGNTLPVAGWYAPNGELWKPNTLITIISDTWDLPGGYTYLIEQVEFTFSTSGMTANLKLVPPQVYTRDPVPYPWEIKG